MKNRSLRLVIAIAWLLVAGVRPGLSQTVAPVARTTPSPITEEDIVILPSFGPSYGTNDRFNAADAMSTARTDRILDTPMTVNIVPKELMGDLGASSLYDAARYFGGMSNGRGAGAGGIMDRLNFRGFESFGRDIDHFSGLLLPTGAGPQANFDPAFVERAELFMGPEMILPPTGGPGGSVNVITKSPQFQSTNEINAQIGNYNAQKITLDSTGPVNQHLAYRVIGSYRDTKTYEPGKLQQTNGSVQLAYKFSDASRLTFKWFGEDSKLTGAAANPNDNGEIVSDPSTILGMTLGSNAQPGFRYDGWNGSARWSQRIDRLNIGELEYTGVIADRISVRLAAQVLYDNYTQDVGYPSVQFNEFYDVTGNVIGVADTSRTSSNPANLTELAQIVHQVNYDEQIQNDYAANFHPGGVSLQPMVGWSYQQGSEPTNVNRLDNNVAGSMPNTNLFLTDNYAPPHPLLSQYSSAFSEQVEHAWLYQAHGLVKAGFYDNRILLTGGVSRTWASPQVYTDTTVGTTNASLGPGAIILDNLDFTGAQKANAIVLNNFGDIGSFNVNSAGNLYRVTQKGFQDTYLGGVVLKAIKNVSLYYSFSTDVSIPGNTPVVWQQGKQHEFGLKAGFFNQRLLFTASHFQISESFPPTYEIVGSGLPRAILLSDDLANRGFEFNMAGGLTNNLSIVASFTEMKLRDSLGRRQRNVPDQLANLLLNYHFTEGTLKGFDAFAGVVHMGSVAGETSNHTTFLFSGVEQTGFYLAPWAVFNAGAGYAWRRYNFNLNVDNVLDSKFWWQPAGRASVSPYPGITVRLASTVHF